MGRDNDGNEIYYVLAIGKDPACQTVRQFDILDDMYWDEAKDAARGLTDQLIKEMAARHLKVILMSCRPGPDGSWLFTPVKGGSK